MWEIMNDLTINNTLTQWLVAMSLFLGCCALLGGLKYTVGGKKHSLGKNLEFSGRLLVRTLFHKISWLAIIVFALNISRLALTVPEDMVNFIETVNRVVFIYQIGCWLDAVVRLLVQLQTNRNQAEDNTKSESSIRLVGSIGRVILWVVIGLLILDNIPGIEINSLIASLGISGIAVALAVQSILSDLFASVTIAMDKPFATGDFIKVEDQSGTVERIGLRSTCLRATTGEALVVSNRKLLDAWVNNYQDLEQRRITFNLSVRYDTGYASLSRLPDILAEIFVVYDLLILERVTFKDYGDSALIFEVVYLVTTGDFNVYIDLRHRINLEIYQRFEEEGIEFALPTHTLYIENEQGS